MAAVLYYSGGKLVASAGNLYESSTTTFNYFISPTGSNSNPGTLAQPWAITALNANGATYAGQNVGIIADQGQYNISALMVSANYSNALQINGGTSSASPTYVASCTSAGVAITNRANFAVLNAETGGGDYGGGLNYQGGMIGQNAGATTNQGYVTLSYIKLIGFGRRATQWGTYAVGSPLPGFTQSFTEVTGGSAAGFSSDNCPAIETMNVTGCHIENNYIHDNIGWDGTNSADHLDGILAWETTSGYFRWNTIVNAGALYGKEYVNQGNEIAYNYIDCSMFTAQSSANGMQDFTGATTGSLTLTSKIHHNIVLSSFFGLGGSTLSQSYGWTTPALIYSNTFVMSNPSGIVETAMWLYAENGGGLISTYNNILTGSVSPDYKMLRTSPNSNGLLDYNLYPASMTWALVTDANGATLINAYTTLSAFLSAVTSNGGTQATYDGHSIQNNTPGFVGSGATLSDAYQITSGGAAHLAGSTTGLSSGSACDMGAWGYDPATGNPPTQIGSSIGP
jgi:hypothetical protein